MAILASAAYDPAAAVTKATTALLAMTAVDTVNLRLAFTVPANGSVLVKMSCGVHGAATYPRILLGILEGANVKARVTPMGSIAAAIATDQLAADAVFVVSGLAPGANLTWDAAYGVEILLAATGIKYGGPNNATTNDAFGAFTFEVWETGALLGAKLYDPAAAVTKVMTGLLAMTVFDTANLRIAFNAPTTGRVLWRIRGVQHGSTTYGQALFGILEGANVIARRAPVKSLGQTSLATSALVLEATGVISGLVSGSAHTYDAAYGVEIIAGAGGIKYGGPNDAVTDNAFGALAFEIWAA